MTITVPTLPTSPPSAELPVAHLGFIPHGPGAPDAVAALCFEQCFRDSDGHALLIRWRESWWTWEDDRGCWTLASDEDLDWRLARILRFAQYMKFTAANPQGALTDWAPTPQSLANVRLMLRHYAKISAKVELGQWLSGYGPEVVSCKASYLKRDETDISRDLLWSYHDATPALFNVHALSVMYDPNAELPYVWTKFLSESLDEQGIALLQEWFGYILSGSTKRHKALQIIGAPRSGKGVITRVLSALLGESSRSSTILSLNGPFGLQPLLGASLVTLNDVRVRAGQEGNALGVMLNIIGEDEMTVNRKGLAEMGGVRMPCRIMLTGNQPIVMKDDSGALDARWLFLRTRGTQPVLDYDLERTLTEESVLQGIIDWALVGLDRLNHRNAFTTQDAAADDREAARTGGSPVLMFLNDRYERSDDSVLFDQFYAEYVGWLPKGERQPFKTEVRSALKSAGLNTTRPKTADRTNLPLVIRGLSHLSE